MRSANEIQDHDALTHGPLPLKSNDNSTREKVPQNIYPVLASGTAESTQHFALAARATNDAIRDWDVTSGRLSWPQGLQTLLGHTPSIVSEDIGFWQRHVHPDDRARVGASIRVALKATQAWSGEYRFRRADGVYVHLLERAIILRDTHAKAVRFVGSLMDITARKHLQDQLCRSQGMEAFGQLANGVAHDFNNFLTTIMGYSDLLLDELAVKGRVAHHLTEIRSAAARASVLTAQLLAFGRKHPLVSSVLDVNELVGNLDRSLLRLLGEDISVECNLQRAKAGLHVKVDPGQLTQIILNLVVNAREAMPAGGQITLATARCWIDDKTPANGSLEFAPGEYVSISVADNGTGMSEEVKARLFEPFFTTKDGTRGSGLGLAISYGIVRQSGGEMRVESELGHGTKVTIYIPKVAPPPAPNYKRPSASEAPTGTETVLVLEDDVSVRHISIRVLQGLGYDVIEAANADDARRLLAEHGERKIHLLLTDIVMPQMNGRDFAKWLHQTRPDTKVVFISGYLDESMQADGLLNGDPFFLPKPFNPGQLAQKVRQALDAKS